MSHNGDPTCQFAQKRLIAIVINGFDIDERSVKSSKSPNTESPSNTRLSGLEHLIPFSFIWKITVGDFPPGSVMALTHAMIEPGQNPKEAPSPLGERGAINVSPRHISCVRADVPGAHTNPCLMVCAPNQNPEKWNFGQKAIFKILLLKQSEP